MTNDNIQSVTDAMSDLSESSGQSYVTVDHAMELLKHFGRFVTAEYVERNTPHSGAYTPKRGAVALSHAVADKKRDARDARGILTVMPHVSVLTNADVSAIIVEGIGGEPDDTHHAGAGFTSDARHEANVETIEEMLDGIGIGKEGSAHA